MKKTLFAVLMCLGFSQSATAQLATPEHMQIEMSFDYTVSPNSLPNASLVGLPINDQILVHMVFTHPRCVRFEDLTGSASLPKEDRRDLENEIDFGKVTYPSTYSLIKGFEKSLGEKKTPGEDFLLVENSNNTTFADYVIINLERNVMFANGHRMTRLFLHSGFPPFDYLRGTDLATVAGSLERIFNFSGTSLTSSRFDFSGPTNLAIEIDVSNVSVSFSSTPTSASSGVLPNCS